jgi:hypothetical protein
MGRKQQYGIRYPFTAENSDNIYMDTNDSYTNSIKSQVVHVIFTPKGQKVRDPDFGTNLINYIFGPKDGVSLGEIKTEITSQLGKYVPAAKFKDVNIYEDENSDNGIIVTISYSVQTGNKVDDTTVAIKL